MGGLKFANCGRGRSSTKSLEDIGRDAQDAFEGARKMELVLEAGPFGNLLDQRSGLLQPLGGEVHF